MRIIVCFLLVSVLSSSARAQLAVGVSPGNVEIVGDSISASLSGATGDAIRGQAIVFDRAAGNCLICHQVPATSEPFQGNVGPDLSGVGSRLSEGQIRLRLVDQSRLNPATLMPPFYRVDDLTRVAARFKGAPVLSAAQLEDVLAFLVSLKN